MWLGIIERYADHLPVTEATPRITLNEGNTPLVKLPQVSAQVGCQVFAKYEGLNPTGSFKDRGMTMAVSKAVEEGAKAIICASTGNTSASAAAYAARAGIKCWVLLPAGKIAKGKLAQALFYGAEVLAIEGNFDQALTLVRELAEKLPVKLVNSVNPMRLQGQKTAAFEICDALGEAPAALALPVGNAGNISAYWMGFKEYQAAGKSKSLPLMLGFEAAGAAPLTIGHVVENPETVATAIRIGNPASWDKAVQAAAESQGSIQAVTDDEILSAQKLLAQKEGIFVEPASAASVAGILKWSKEHRFDEEDKVVCVLTGHGLKDPDIAVQESPEPRTVPSDFDAVSELMAAGVK
ncbi:MAG: threonine synthase [bacterium]